jgi:S1-C subfamily serine protease
MKKVTLYSTSSRARPSGRPPTTLDPHARTAPPPNTATQPQDQPAARAEIRPPLRTRFAFLKRYERSLLVVTGALFALLLVSLHEAIRPAVRQITQRDIDAAVLHTLETQPLPSAAARAYEAIRPSVVRVRGFGQHGKDGEEAETGVGSGVVIVEKGVILTNLHVVAGAKRVKVVFADGLESDASIVGLQPEHDLAVLQAATVPDDLVPATLRSTADLAPGDTVIAVGFPFGIGPSVSAGVVSGLRREFQSPQGERLLTNLIQFDAAANPGSSGGPLVTPDGEVVGIVTAILNPTQQRVFVGIGFAVPIENAASAVGIHPF